MNKINCRWHPDATASMHIYADHAYCFGCKKRVSLEEIGEKATFTRRSFNYTVRKENIKSSLERINKLPKKLIRGLPLPFDESGYYLVYPNTDYYVKRLWEGTNSNKYKNPLGLSKELFRVRLAEPKEALLIVEGQLNALTADTVFRQANVSIISPGSANDLNNRKFIEYYLQYKRVCLIVDKDAAGVVSATALRDTLLKSGIKRVAIYPMQKDLNQVLLESGEDAVRQEVHQAVEML